MPLPGPSRRWSSGSQPNSYIIGAMKIDGSATRPVTTIWAPARSASTIGSAPRYASAEISVSARASRSAAPFSRMRVGQLEHAVGDQAAGDGRDLDAAVTPSSRSQCDDALRRAVRIDPPLVRDDPRALRACTPAAPRCMRSSR